MRYPAEHKAEVHQKIVVDASHRLRAEGMSGAAVAAVMRDTGLTHGGFYKHFASKDDLLLQSLHQAFGDMGDVLVKAAQHAGAAQHAQPGAGWKAIVKTYLSSEYCEQVASGCPLTALAPELARAEPAMKRPILKELVAYKDRMIPFMPGRRAADRERAFFALFSTMIGAVELARMLPEPAMREKVLTHAREFLLKSF